MNILLVAGGSPDEWPKFDVKKIDYFVGIDRGSLYILNYKWPLHLAVGDFDSLNEAEQQKVYDQALEIKQVTAEKDDTDTQLALALTLEKFPKAKIILIGATGGRLDHLLANIWLPLEPRFQPFARQIKLQDRQNSITYYLPGNYTVEKEKGMNYLAYCCLTPVSNLTLSESKYTLLHAVISRPTSFASNEFLAEKAFFSFDSGMVAVVQSVDE